MAGNSEAQSKSSKVYLLNNKAKRPITINGVRLTVGINFISDAHNDALMTSPFLKLKASPYFEPYFDDDKDLDDRLEWVDGFGPDDYSGKSLVSLSEKEFKKVIKEVMDIKILDQLEIDAKKAEIKALILEQKKKVLPSEKEINE